MDQEKRKYARVRQRLTTLVKFLDTGKVRRALTRDIGAGGVCVVMEGVLEPGTMLEVELRLPDRQQPITFTASVIWNRPLETLTKSYEIPTTETGVTFVNIDPKERAFLMQYAAMNPLPPELGGT